MERMRPPLPNYYYFVSPFLNHSNLLVFLYSNNFDLIRTVTNKN